LTSAHAGPGGVSPGKAIGWSIAFIVLTFLTGGLLILAVAVLIHGSNDSAAKWLGALGPGSMLLQAVVTLATAAVFTWLIGVRRLGLTRDDLRYRTHQRGASGFAVGLLAGALTAGFALLISVLAGQATWIREPGTFGNYLTQALKTVAVLAPAALAEEVLFRGVPLVLLARAFGRGSAVVAIAVLFAFSHVTNPNATPLGLGNIALAGIFLGLAFYLPGGIWTAFGAHLGWNTLLACLDTPVSGVPFEIPMLDYSAGSPAWLTGGGFGPEGGLAATLALTAAIVVTTRYAAKESA
jgi:membrane protease YdiL (CAAX protease family)